MGDSSNGRLWAEVFLGVSSPADLSPPVGCRAEADGLFIAQLALLRDEDRAAQRDVSSQCHCQTIAFRTVSRGFPGALPGFPVVLYRSWRKVEKAR